MCLILASFLPGNSSRGILCRGSSPTAKSPGEAPVPKPVRRHRPHLRSSPLLQRQSPAGLGDLSMVSCFPGLKRRTLGKPTNIAQVHYGGKTGLPSCGPSCLFYSISTPLFSSLIDMLNQKIRSFATLQKTRDASHPHTLAPDSPLDLDSSFTIFIYPSSIDSSRSNSKMSVMKHSPRTPAGDRSADPLHSHLKLPAMIFAYRALCCSTMHIFSQLGNSRLQDIVVINPLISTKRTPKIIKSTSRCAQYCSTPKPPNFKLYI